MGIRTTPHSARRLSLFAAMLAFSLAAFAGDMGTVASARQDPLPIYKSPADAAPSGTMAVHDLPWAIQDAKDGFLLVAVGGKRFWVDAMDVLANRESSDRCSKRPALQDVAGQPGAANAHCK